MLSTLVRRAEVDLVCLDDGTAVELPSEIGRFIAIANKSAMKRVCRIAFGLVRGIPIHDEYYNSKQLSAVLGRLRIREYNMIVVHRLPVHRLPPLKNHPNLVYDCDDCDTYKGRLFASKIGGLRGLLYRLDAALTPRHERAACNAARTVLVTADREGERLREVGVTRPIRCWLAHTRMNVQKRDRGTRERLVVSFHGKMSYIANALALKRINDEIAPQLDPLRFDLRMIGKCSTRQARAYPNLHFTGYVDSIPEAISDSDLSIFPLPLSVGYPNKVMESLGCGVPLIVAPGVMDGLPAVPEVMERGVWIREISEFPAEIERFSRLPHDARQEIADRIRACAERLWQSANEGALWDEILGEVRGYRCN